MELKFSDDSLTKDVEGLFKTASEIFKEGFIYAGCIVRRGGEPIHFDFRMEYLSAQYADRHNHEIRVEKPLRAKLDTYANSILDNLEKRVRGVISTINIAVNSREYVLRLLAETIVVSIGIRDKLNVEDVDILRRLRSELGTDIKSCRLLPLAQECECEVEPDIIEMHLLPENRNEDIVGVIRNNGYPYVFFPIKKIDFLRQEV